MRNFILSLMVVVMIYDSKYPMVDVVTANNVETSNHWTERSALEQIIRKFEYQYLTGGKVFVKLADQGLSGIKGFEQKKLDSIRSNLLNKTAENQ